MKTIALILALLATTAQALPDYNPKWTFIVVATSGERPRLMLPNGGCADNPHENLDYAEHIMIAQNVGQDREPAYASRYPNFSDLGWYWHIVDEHTGQQTGATLDMREIADPALDVPGSCAFSGYYANGARWDQIVVPLDASWCADGYMIVTGEEDRAGRVSGFRRVIETVCYVATVDAPAIGGLYTMHFSVDPPPPIDDELFELHLEIDALQSDLRAADARVVALEVLTEELLDSRRAFVASTYAWRDTAEYWESAYRTLRSWWREVPSDVAYKARNEATQ